jgi:hypothetical protein
VCHPDPLGQVHYSRFTGLRHEIRDGFDVILRDFGRVFPAGLGEVGGLRFGQAL